MSEEIIVINLDPIDYENWFKPEYAIGEDQNKTREELMEKYRAGLEYHLIHCGHNFKNLTVKWSADDNEYGNIWDEDVMAIYDHTCEYNDSH